MTKWLVYELDQSWDGNGYRHMRKFYLGEFETLTDAELYCEIKFRHDDVYEIVEVRS